MLSFYPPSISNRYDPEISRGFQTFDGKSSLALCGVLKNYIWAPCVWQGGRRNKDTFLYADYIGLDFENEEVSLAHIARTYCDWWHILGTTRNHQKWKGEGKNRQSPRDRFRLLLRFERRITCVHEFEYNVRRLVEQEGADTACIDGAHLFYPCTDIVSKLIEEDAFFATVHPGPTAEHIKSEFDKNTGTESYQRLHGIVSYYARQWLTAVIPDGERAVKCFYIACDLARAGWSYHEVIDSILASPTFAGKELGRASLQKIHRQVRDGFKKEKFRAEQQAKKLGNRTTSYPHFPRR